MYRGFGFGFGKHDKDNDYEEGGDNFLYYRVATALTFVYNRVLMAETRVVPIYRLHREDTACYIMLY